jgi:ribosome assembly protein 3
VSSSSDTDSDSASSSSDVPVRKDEEAVVKVSQAPSTHPDSAPEHSAKKAKKKAKPTANDDDVAMPDAPAPAPIPKLQSATQINEAFGAIYLRRLAAELADDLDKVRTAQDFKANSVPMLIHALKQGESVFSLEEKRRVVGASS